jgi:predicted dinucleotide-binding enzyme
MKKIGIIGSGPVGKTLAAGLLKEGYPVLISSRSEETLKNITSEIEGDIHTGGFREAAGFGEIVFLAVKGLAALDALKIIGTDVLENKIIVDTTNPIAEAPPANGVLRFFTSLDRSLMEQLQESFPTARFVKAFNSIGSALMVNPFFHNGEKPSMFICGNDDDAKLEVRKINELLGFETEDMGAAEAARAIEPLCMLWCIPGFRDNSWGHAFRLLK